MGWSKHKIIELLRSQRLYVSLVSPAQTALALTWVTDCLWFYSTSSLPSLFIAAARTLLETIPAAPRYSTKSSIKYIIHILFNIFTSGDFNTNIRYRFLLIDDKGDCLIDHHCKRECLKFRSLIFSLRGALTARNGLCLLNEPLPGGSVRCFSPIALFR